MLVAAPPLPTCSSLDADFTVDETNPPETVYIIEVSDSSNFIVNGSLQINDRGGNLRRFSIITLIDGTHVRVHPLFTVNANTTFKAGASVCYVEDKCAITALDASGQIIGALLGCINGNSKPLAPSGDNKILTSKDGFWTEASRGLGFFPKGIQLYNGSSNSVVTHNWDNLFMPDKAGGQQIYADIEVWAVLAGASGCQAVVEINGSGYITLYTNGNGTNPPGGGAQSCRFTTKVQATAGGSISMRIYARQGSPTTLTGTITLNGYYA